MEPNVPIELSEIIGSPQDESAAPEVNGTPDVFDSFIEERKLVGAIGERAHERFVNQSLDVEMHAQHVYEQTHKAKTAPALREEITEFPGGAKVIAYFDAAGVCVRTEKKAAGE